MKRKCHLEHDNAVTSWTLSVLPEIWIHVESELTGEHCLLFERVVEWLHHPRCQNDQVSGYNMKNIIDLRSCMIWLVPMPFVEENFYSWCPRGEVSYMAWNILFATHVGIWIPSLQGNIQEVGNQVRRTCLECYNTYQGSNHNSPPWIRMIIMHW